MELVADLDLALGFVFLADLFGFGGDWLLFCYYF